jgi:hypothetical protein
LTSPDQPTLAWIDPTGVTWDLSTASGLYWALPGVKGLGAAPRAITSDPSVRGGSTIRQIQPAARTITLPIYVEGDTHSLFLATWRALALAFTSTRSKGAGQLVSMRPDGTSRVIDCTFADGWDGDPDLGVHEDILTVSLYAETPWWRDPNPTTVSRQYQSTSTSYLAPYPSVSSDTTLGTTTINNPGDVESYPSWTVNGPASSVTAALNSTGQTWTIDPNATSIGHGSLVAGETVTFITDPFAVTGPDGSSWTGALNWPTADGWALQPGDNSVTYTVTGSGVGTTITLSFFARYETA